MSHPAFKRMKHLFRCRDSDLAVTVRDLRCEERKKLFPVGSGLLPKASKVSRAMTLLETELRLDVARDQLTAKP